MVKALMAEMIVETAMVTANWRKNWPVMPARKQHGMNTELSTSVMASIGPVISSMALMVAVRGVQAGRDQSFDVLQHDDGVVHHDADGQHQPEQRQVVQAEAQAAMTAKVPIRETGTSIIGRIIALQSWRNTSTTMATRITASRSVLKTSLIDSLMNGVVS